MVQLGKHLKFTSGTYSLEMDMVAWGGIEHLFLLRPFDILAYHAQYIPYVLNEVRIQPIYIKVSYHRLKSRRRVYFMVLKMCNVHPI